MTNRQLNIPDVATNDELFDVWQFLADGYAEKVREAVTVKYAVDAAYHYTHSVGAMAGITRRVIIVDEGDMTCFEWRFGEGVVFPEQPQTSQREYHK